MIKEAQVRRDALLTLWERIEKNYNESIQSITHMYEWKSRKIIEELKKIDEELNNGLDNNQVIRK